MFFHTKQKQLEAKLATYREKAALCVKQCQETLERYCAASDAQQLETDARQVHRLESEADDIRRDIEDMMYTQALFPESRSDILVLLEMMDAVPNQAQVIVRAIHNQFITIPEGLQPRLLELADIGRRAVDVMLQASEKLFSDFTGATVLTGKIDELESEGDHAQALLTRTIFSSDDLPPLDKILLRDLVDAIGALSDLAQNVGDCIRLIVVKRVM